MSASKDGLARPRLDFVRVSKQHPCPVCGHDGFCRITSDGREAWCMRCDEGHDRVFESSIGTTYVHRLADARPVMQPRLVAPADDAPPRASVEALDRAYRVVLSQLGLNTNDREALLARGLDSRSIAACSYRSSRSERGWRVAKAIVDRVGAGLARRVPGVVWRHRVGEAPERGWWHWRVADGVLIPVRDIEGRIVGLKVRLRGESALKYGRYAWVSSASRGTCEGDQPQVIDLHGPSALYTMHIPIEARSLRSTSSRLIVTEGELKADVATALLGEPVVSLPGVSAWARGVDIAKLWGASEVVVAFDMDACSNPLVARARDMLVSKLRQEGLTVAEWEWPYDGARWKGLDDYLLAMRTEKCEVRHGR